LPNVTPEVADAILDWLDADETPRQYGAESDYYQSLSPPYQPRNGPLHSLDELLLVAGVTPRMLYGEDANRNGVLDANEDDGDVSSPNDDANGTLDRGWLPYLTLYSHEANVDQLGEKRVFLNDSDLQSLYDQLASDVDFGEERARFIIAYRLFGAASSGQQGSGQQGGGQGTSQGGPQSGGQQPGAQSGQPGPSGGQPGQSGGQPGLPSQGGQGGGGPGSGGAGPPGGANSGAGGQNPGGSQSGDQSGSGSSGSSPQQTIAGFDASGGAQQNISSVVDLIGVSVNVRIPGQQQTTELKSPFQESDVADFMDLLLDRTTTTDKTELWGRINVNTSPWPALMSLPGMTEDLADAIVAARGSSDTSGEAMSNLGVAWLLSSGAVTKDQFKSLEQFVTGQTQVFSVQSVGYFEEGGPISRAEAVIDMSKSSPRIRFWRDLSGLGRGYDPQSLLGTVSR
jgi:hypothetical protein